MDSISSTAITLASEPSSLVLDAVLTIKQHESIRRSLRTAFGVRTRSLHLRVDPAMDLLFLCEAVVPGSSSCLAAVTHPAVTSVVLRQATLTRIRNPKLAVGQGSASLRFLEKGNCFLTANSQKVPIASFGPTNVQLSQIEMELLGQPNLLEFLRAEFFTLEISGTNWRRLSCSLTLQVNLQFEVRSAMQIRAKT
ncbi:hypothetical protein CDA63_11530 [Hymenobacter amundsenii]|uniref:Uncharacterized protein n=1 Tax=Hymenobacter amundsenii TaxID=2006685 RepID=A0A246FK98_9BACT|nr:hypothetical protein [Hymenobacter amundsenii]OWP63004.1 hypothetical protein CDA63_11530 [Hymenobacter amundsenii]